MEDSLKAPRSGYVSRGQCMVRAGRVVAADVDLHPSSISITHLHHYYKSSSSDHPVPSQTTTVVGKSRRPRK
jgi:hypothetical protein